LEALKRAIHDVLSDNLLSSEEERRLKSFLTEFSITQADAPEQYLQIVKGGILRDLTEGKVPTRVNVDGSLPFNLQRGEKLIWLFEKVDLIEEHRHTHYEGRSAGLSIRIAKGVYYRTSAFRGHPVQTTAMEVSDRGFLGVTNKHIYFAGSAKSFRVALNHIVRFQSFDDGVGITKDTASAKLIVFRTGDGWFTNNLLQNLNQIETKSEPQSDAA